MLNIILNKLKNKLPGPKDPRFSMSNLRSIFSVRSTIRLLARGFRQTKSKKFQTTLFYILIGIASSAGFFLILYWALSINSSMTSIYVNTKSEPLYFWPYTILTIGTIILFGVNVALLTYRIRKYGFPKIWGQSGTGVGSLVGIAASSCPVCGSTLLSALGIVGGLAVFPLQGLELKALSFGLMALPIWLTRRELKRFECKDETCPIPRNHFLKKGARAPLLLLSSIILVLFYISWTLIESEPLIQEILAKSQPNNSPYSINIPITGNKIYDETVANVLPQRGFKSQIILGNSTVKLVDYGVIDKTKFEEVYKNNGGLPDELSNVLSAPSYKPITLTRENANYYVNILWPLGLANYMNSNNSSPVNGNSLFNFASTGGWRLGKEQNGGSYFNKFSIVVLTAEQESIVTKIAQNTYRPCCNNSTFFQDCNHGSALLGLLELGVSQGLTEDELYREALAFNSFWFPNNYIQTALYFKAVKGIAWRNVNPKEVLGYEYSTAEKWNKNVSSEVSKIPKLLPEMKNNVRCGA